MRHARHVLLSEATELTPEDTSTWAGISTILGLQAARLCTRPSKWHMPLRCPCRDLFWDSFTDDHHSCTRIQRHFCGLNALSLALRKLLDPCLILTHTNLHPFFALRSQHSKIAFWGLKTQTQPPNPPNYPKNPKKRNDRRHPRPRTPSSEKAVRTSALDNSMSSQKNHSDQGLEFRDLGMIFSPDLGIRV